MFAGAFLTMSTAAGAHAAQIIAGLNPALSRFTFAFIFTWGLVYVVFFKWRVSYFKYDVLNTGAIKSILNGLKQLLFYSIVLYLI